MATFSRLSRSRGLLLFAFLGALSLLSSCTGKIGYGVINWSVPEYSLYAGDVVPVFIQSNIGKVYVVGLDSSETRRAELPLWQLTLYKSRSKANKAAAALAEFRYTYATVKLDGLPVRADPENTSRQVYRLKEGEKIKIVRMGKGSPVIAANAPLAGDWYEVMTDDGTAGWCFSYNLAFFDERETDSGLAAAVDSGPDPVLENLLTRSWYPESWRAMLRANRVIPPKIDSRQGFFPGRTSQVARVEGIDGVITFPYTGITRTEDGVYRFEGTSLTVQARRGDLIMVQYTDQAGMPRAEYFAALDSTPDQIVSDENERRAALAAAVTDLSERFSSGNYGVLQFIGGDRFLWSGYQLLVPSVIPPNSGGGGSVAFDRFLGDTLPKDYTGALSLSFDQAPSPLTFLYVLEATGLKLEFVPESLVRDSVVESRSLTPTVIYFSPEQTGQGGF